MLSSFLLTSARLVLRPKRMAYRSTDPAQVFPGPGYVAVGSNQDPSVSISEQATQRSGRIEISVLADSNDLRHRRVNTEMPVFRHLEDHRPVRQQIVEADVRSIGPA